MIVLWMWEIQAEEGECFNVTVGGRKKQVVVVVVIIMSKKVRCCGHDTVLRNSEAHSSR